MAKVSAPATAQTAPQTAKPVTQTSSAAPQASATGGQPAPVTPAVKVKKAKTKRIPHPLIGSEDKTLYPFKTVPADFDAKLHKPLKERNFASPADFMDYKASKVVQRIEALQAEVDDLRKQAATERKYGNSDKLKKAKKRNKLLAMLAKLEKELDEEGVSDGAAAE